jgi:hypothetical protein
MTADLYWRKWQKIGWLRYVPKHQQEEIRACLEKNFKANPKWAYLCLNQAGIDSECIDGPGSYRSVLKDLARDSHGLFHPTRIREEHVALGKRKHGIKVSFSHDGKRFSTTVPFDGDYFEMGILDLVNESLAASGTKERFIELPAVDQLVFLVLVPPSIYDKAVAAKLIPGRDKVAGRG